MLQGTLSSPAFAAFIFASIVLAVTPGPGVIYLVTRTLSQGRKAGLASIGGIALGDFGNALAASIGLAAVLGACAAAFVVVKFAGALYLIFLGMRALRAPKTAHVSAPIEASLLHPFRDAFWVALLNPKTALFFAALMPQFIDPHRSSLGQSLILSGVFVSIAMCTDTLYVLAASTLAPAITRRSRWFPYGKYVSAATFIGLGVYAAFASPRSSR
jgi:threonine/homoserine/homoserine lactone efflux protein